MNKRTIANRYQIEEELGRGGMAVVYRALDLRLNRHVALKLLHPFLATQKESAERFIREAEAIAKLHHPNIVEIFDAGCDEDSGSHYLVMELIEGPTLSVFIQEHPTKIPEIGLAMGCCLCDAVEHAHNAGIIHRDIKPENIMISSDGLIKLMDFGIARVLTAERMTASGSLVGSPAHMPPEIIEGQPYGFTCDIFSMGTVIYYLLTNALPFQGNTPMTVFKAILDNQYQKPSRVCLSVSKNIDKIVAQCLQTEPDARYQTPSALKNDILPVLSLIHFDNYNEILSRYFLDPDKFNQEMLPEIKKALNDSARLAVHERRLPAALENLNCVLAYDPNDTEANALLQKLRTGDIIKKRVGISLGVLILLLGIVCCVLWVFHPDKSNLATDTNQPHQIKLPVNAVHEVTSGNAENDITVKEQPSAINDNHADSPGIPSDLWKMERIPENDSFVLPTLTAINEKPETTAVSKHEPVRNTKPKTTSKPSENNMTEPLVEDTPDTSEVNEQNSSDTPTQTEEPAKPVMAKVVQPVFPPDAFAVINGHRYDANSSGDIVMELSPGTYKMVLSCDKRCVRQTETLTVSGDKPSERDVVSLEWKDASLNLQEPEGVSVYFMARRLDDRNQRIFHMAAKTPNVVNGFNAFGKPIQLEVYAIPNSNTLKSYDLNALEQAKYASTRVSIGPGEVRTLKF